MWSVGVAFCSLSEGQKDASSGLCDWFSVYIFIIFNPSLTRALKWERDPEWKANSANQCHPNNACAWRSIY